MNWVTDLLDYAGKHELTRIEAIPEAEARWVEFVSEAAGKMLMSKAKGWMTGYNPNAGRMSPTKTRLVYTGGQAKYRRLITEVAAKGYEGLTLR